MSTGPNYYDKESYPIKIQDAEGRETQTEYNLDGGVNRYSEVRRLADRNGNATVYDRDARGNILKVTNPDGSTKVYTYDDKNNLLSQKDETGLMRFYVYDSAKQNCIKEAAPLNGTTTYSETVNQDLFSVTKYLYYTAAEASTMCAGRTFYGLLKTKTDPMGGTVTYTYDSRGHVKSSTNPLGKATAYEYNL